MFTSAFAQRDDAARLIRVIEMSPKQLSGAGQLGSEAVVQFATVFVAACRRSNKLTSEVGLRHNFRVSRHSQSGWRMSMGSWSFMCENGKR